MNYTRINTGLGWLSFLIATSTYLFTIEPTASLWDAGEFIAAAYKMQIVHQPGAPLFLMLQNIFSNAALGNPASIAYWMNAGSAIASGFTILFLFWTITALAKKALVKKGESLSQEQLIRIMGAGLIGALGYTFTDTFWFSAVESEVYAMASLCTAIVFWAILKWEAIADEPEADRWLIFIAYIMGLSIGVHLLNLLTIPALALVFYYRKTKQIRTKGILASLGIGCLILAVVLWGVIQYLIKFAAYFDLFFVNSLGLGFGSGVIVFIVLLVSALTYGIVYSIKKNKYYLNLAFIALSFIIIGYSSFSMILIRATANPNLNNNDPDNTFSFLGYLNREQYGDVALFKGAFFDSKPIDYTEGSSIYRKGKDNYVKVGDKFGYKYDRETILPRIYSSDHADYYRSWLNLGENEQPTFGDNLNFLFTYQIGHMYARYFMWNFVGRQNDQQGHGDYTKGNWISGIKALDEMRLGGQYVLPDSQKDHPSRNTYYFLPLLLGLAGLVWHVKRNGKDAGIVALLFFFTGIAIVLYLNQNPNQPRERDYAFAGSFYAFSIWIGLGVMALSEVLRKKIAPKTAAIAAGVVSLICVPVLLATQNWDDHDRSKKTTARDLFAINYLESCAPNAILFTYGDNDTFPLWYAQEVENIRPDVRVVNLSYLTADWYLRQMKVKANQADALPLSMTEDQFVRGVRDMMPFEDYGIAGNIELEDILHLLLSDDPQDQQQMQDGSSRNFLPTKNFKLTVDKDAVISHSVVPEHWESEVVDSIVWHYNKDYVSKGELAIIDVLVQNNWARPIYFARTVPPEFYLGLDSYLITEGYAYRLMPIKKVQKEDPNESNDKINTLAMYDHIMNKFEFGDLNQASFLDPTSYGLLGMVMNTFSSLSDQLVKEGNDTDAKAVMDRGRAVLPKKIFEMRETIQRQAFVSSLYQVNDLERANKMTTMITDYIDQNINYYLAVAATKSNLELDNMRIGMYVLYSLERLTDHYGQDKENDRIKKLLADFEKQLM